MRYYYKVPDAKNWLLRKDPDAGKDWRHEEKGVTENEMVGWHHWLDGHKFEQAPGVGDGKGGLASCSPWSCKESDMIKWLNWTTTTFYTYVMYLGLKSMLLCLSFTQLYHIFLHILIISANSLLFLITLIIYIYYTKLYYVCHIIVCIFIVG